MADPKDPREGESFFRKVVRFVANPATDWSEVAATRPNETQEVERSELKAMVERKRRNDFVRKREFDTLRRLRRDGLSPEQLAALGGSSKVDDSEVRQTENSVAARSDVGVKAKIDEIEQQMVGDGGRRDSVQRRPAAAAPRPLPPQAQRPTDFYNAATEPVSFDPGRASPPPAPARAGAPQHPSLDHLPSLQDLDYPLPSPSAAPVTMAGSRAPLSARPANPGAAPRPAMPPDAQARGSQGVVSGAGLSGQTGMAAAPGRSATAASTAAPAAGLPHVDLSFDANSRFAVEVNELVHDPELDEAVIAFANADFNHCEQALTALVKANAARYRHAETWYVLFDLYRATGQQARFESLSLDYAHLFGRSSPQWYSLPKRVADAAADDRPDTRGVKGDVGWISPALLDVESVARLRSATLQLPLPWVLDWSALQRVEVEAAAQLQLLFRQWAPQAIDMRWLSAERLLGTLQEAAPTGVRDADPAFWMARLEALRLANRPDQFDEAAIDYCVTYEVSPPSWERARCQVRASSANNSTTTPPLSIIGEVSSFMESGLDDGHAAQAGTTVDLSGQLAGDISAILQQLDRKLGKASLVQVSCARLIRVDFIAAGDLLNWVLAKRTENRNVTFAEAHRLVALFFGAMGINEHARVQVPRD